MENTNNMIIKLRMPGEEVRFECPNCSRSFTSSKGLGAHKRVHMEKGSKRSLETGMEIQVREAGDQPVLFSCPICPHSFPSLKSLHGHMRKHPDRSWRGMRPPALPPVESSEPISPAAPKRSKPNLGESSSMVNNEPPKRFVCDICGKVYKSYRGLGGHKSYHKLQEADVSANQPVDRGEGNRDKPRFMFDLNELPHPDW